MRTIVRLFLIFGVVGAVFGYNPPAGGEEWYEIVSPSYLGSGLDLTRTDAILGDAANPAVSGLVEQPRVAAYYGSLIGPQEAEYRRFGHIVSGAGNLPTKIGVLGLNFLYMDARLDGMDLGRLGRARVGYARDILPNLLIGAAGNVTFGSQERYGFGLSGDLGIVHLVDRFAGMDDFRWALTAHTLGFGYLPHEDDSEGDAITGFPSIFTPGFGFSGIPWSDSSKIVRLGGWVHTPRLQNIRTGGRVDLTFDDFVTVGLAMRYDLRQQTDSAVDHSRSLIPSVGVEVNVTRLLERRERRQENESRSNGVASRRDDEIRSTFAIAPMTGDVVAIGVGVEIPFGRVDREAPTITMGEPESRWISPNNDGVHDDIVVPIDIDDESPIGGYVFLVRDESGETVRTIENKDPRPELKLDALVAEIRKGETGIVVPTEIRWNGRDDTGELVPDGSYTYHLESWDINGNRGSGAESEVVIDTTNPEIAVSAPQGTIFSPNDDGIQDELILSLSGTAEYRIAATIVDADGTEVRTIRYDEEEPRDFQWDGNNDAGEEVPDGTYTYAIESVDRAGNAATAEITGIIVNRDTQSVFVTTDVQAFSPDGDGVAEELSFTLLVPTANGLQSWAFEISDVADDRVLRTYDGNEAGRRVIRWNGTDEAGERKDGVYRGTLVAEYANGGRPRSTSHQVVLDTTAPDLSVEAGPQPFSPDNDGYADELTFNIDIDDLSGIDGWQLAIRDPRDEVFRSFSGRGRPSSHITWSGYSDQGELVEAAEDYPWVFSVTDNVGNETQRQGTIPVDVLVIRDGDRLKIRISNITFAPNSPEFLAEDEEVLEKNFAIVNRIAEILGRYRSYDVRIEGHAVNISGTQREQDEELIPLSRARAETVLQALVERGLDANRFTAVGIGGAEPLVPHTDEENRWRNRRVEFILIR